MYTFENTESLTNNKEHVEFQAEVHYSLFQECKGSQQSTALPPARKAYVIYRSCVPLCCVCCNIRIAVGTWLLSSDLSVYRRPNQQPQGLTCMVALRQLSLWVPQSQFLQGLWKCCSNRHQDAGSDTMSSPPLKGPTWDLGTWMVGSTLLSFRPLLWSSAHSFLAILLNTLFPHSALYFFRAHIPSDLSYLFTHCQSLHWTPVSPWG